MNIKKIIAEINKIEIDIADFINIYKDENLVSDYYNWNYKDVIAHLTEWIVFSKDKLSAIAYNQNFQEVNNIDVFNEQNYIKNKNKQIFHLQNSIVAGLNEYRKVVQLYSDADLQRKDFPIGFSFELWRYIIMDIVIHPVMHLLYYLLKTKKYEFFLSLCKKHNEIFYHYAAGKEEVYSFDEYIEDNKKFIESIKELWVQYQNNDIVNSILKANKIDRNI